MCKYMVREDSAAMLGTKKSAGATPEVNLRNPLHAGHKAHKEGIHPGFETQGGSPKNRGVSSPQKGQMSYKTFLKKE